MGVSRELPAGRPEMEFPAGGNRPKRSPFCSRRTFSRGALGRRGRRGREISKVTSRDCGDKGLPLRRHPRISAPALPSESEQCPTDWGVPSLVCRLGARRIIRGAAAVLPARAWKSPVSDCEGAFGPFVPSDARGLCATLFRRDERRYVADAGRIHVLAQLATPLGGRNAAAAALGTPPAGLYRSRGTRRFQSPSPCGKRAIACCPRAVHSDVQRRARRERPRTRPLYSAGAHSRPRGACSAPLTL